MKYHKIQSVFKRDDRGNFTNEFSRPEFGYLYLNDWEGTEKIDGTNIRIYYSPYNKLVDIRGRTDKAQIPQHLVEYLFNVLTPDSLEKVFPEGEDDPYDKIIIMYGEGFGNKIQKGRRYLGDNVGFALFDVMVGHWWLCREAVEQIADDLGVYKCPVVFTGSLYEAEHFVANGFKSIYSGADAEGLVLRPTFELKDRAGRRIITKLKTKDFK